MAISPFPDPTTPCPFRGHCHMPCAWDSAEYAVGAQEMWRTAKMNGGIKYLACPIQRLKHNRNSITKIATLARLIKIHLLIFPSPCCVLVGRGPRGPWGAFCCVFSNSPCPPRSWP